MSYLNLNPFRARKTGIWSIAIASLAVMTSGCMNVPDRINHIHNDINFEKAKTASKSFESVTSERMGLPAKMRANLGAQKLLRETVAAESARFFDLANLLMIRGITWMDLRRELESDLGWRPSRDILFLLATMNKINTDPRLTSQDKEDFLQDGTILANAFLGIGEIAKIQGLARTDLLNDLLEGVVDDFLQKHQYDLNEEELSDVYNLKEKEIIQLVREYKPAEAGKLIAPMLWNTKEEDRKNFEAFGKRIIKDGTSDLQEREGKKFLSPPKPTINENVKTAIVRTVYMGVRGKFASSEELQKQINKRLGKLGAALKMFEVLIKGERVRNGLLVKSEKRKLVEAKKKFGLKSKKVDDPSRTSGSATGEAAMKKQPDDIPDEPDPVQEPALNLVFSIHESISKFWRDQAHQEEFLAQANQLQRQLLISAEKSRDPAAVFSLVPLAGEGLNSDDLGMLDSYVQYLKGADEAIQTNIDNLKKLEEELAKQEKTLNGKKGKNKILAQVKEFHTAYREFLENNKNENSITPILEEILKAADNLELDLKLASLENLGKELSDLEPPLTEALKNEELDGAKVRTLLELLVGRNTLPKSDNFESSIAKVITPQKVNELQELMKDVNAESESASKRVISFLSALQGLQKQLREESSRHYLALSGIARSEVERWEDLGDLEMDTIRLFVEKKTNSKNESENLLLFEECPTSEAREAGRGEKIADHGTVCLKDKVLPSIRRLAVTAHHFQMKAPQEQDYHGSKTQISVERLARATGILQLYQVMTKLNRLKAAEHSIELFGEVQEHSIQIDNIVVAGVEKEIEYGLENLAAFHGTGLSQDDVDLFVGIIQSGLLAWIGSGVS